MSDTPLKIDREKTGQRNLDDAVAELAGHFGLDFVGEVAKRIFWRLWLDPEERREKLLELNGRG